MLARWAELIPKHCKCFGCRRKELSEGRCLQGGQNLFRSIANASELGHYKCFEAGKVNPDWSNAVSLIQIRDLTGV